MKRVLAGLLSAFAIATFATATVEAQTQCPTEVSKAKEMLSARTAKAGTIQAPRSLAGARQIEAPRGQDVQAPRGQDVQAPRSLAGARQIEAPRGQDVQAPRGQDVQAPRGQDVQAPRSLAGAKAGSSQAFSLVKEAEAACAKGDMATAKAKAEAAIAAMK
jgi:opacity protein-like surface antigen